MKARINAVDRVGQVLRTYSGRGEYLTRQEIARRAKGNPKTVGAILGDLVEAGVIERKLIRLPSGQSGYVYWLS